MKIYVLFPGPLLPIQGMSQVRVLNQLKSLSRDHTIVFSDLVSNLQSLHLAKESLSTFGIEYQPIFSSKWGKNKAFRILRYFLRELRYHIGTVTREELALDGKGLRRQILDIAQSQDIDALILHYWYLGSIFPLLSSSVLRMIDTHYVVEENIELQDRYTVGNYTRVKLKNEFDHSLKKQREYFLSSDLVIVNSNRQKELLHIWNAKLPVNVTVNGQDLTPFIDYQAVEEPGLTICFYGALSNQFNRKALKRILTNIFPALQKEMPGIKLYVIGSSPPEDILGSVQTESVIVTGFVDDVRPILSKCRVMLLPLDTAAGFRGRTVEVMALGIPIIGTHNALQSVGFIDGELGYIEETDAGMIQRTVQLLNDPALAAKMSESCRQFAQKNFSMDATFDKLSRELSAMSAPLRRS